VCLVVGGGGVVVGLGIDDWGVCLLWFDGRGICRSSVGASD